MIEVQAAEMARRLLATYGEMGFEISMPDKENYELMRSIFAHLGRKTGPDGNYFVVKVFPVDTDGEDVNPYLLR